MDRVLHSSSPFTFESLRNAFLFLLCCILLAAYSVCSSRKMKFEARVFFPIDTRADDAAAVASSSASALAAAASTPASAAHFSLFDASDFSHFHPSDSALSFDAHAIEDRTDLYLLDPTMENMESIGLKLRGTKGNEDGSNSSASGDSIGGSQRLSYDLDLKVRKDVTCCAEQWKKVIRTTPIEASFATLAKDVLPAVTKAHIELDMLHKKKLGAVVGGLEEALQQRAEDKEHAFYVVEVRKRRSEIKECNAEQTNVDVKLLWHGDANSSDAAASTSSSSQTLHFRSICFEGSESDTQTSHVRGLFEHLQQRYDGKGQAPQPSSSSTASAAAASTSLAGAFVGGYPGFLMRALNLRSEKQQQTSATQNKAEL